MTAMDKIFKQKHLFVHALEMLSHRRNLTLTMNSKPYCLEPDVLPLSYLKVLTIVRRYFGITVFGINCNYIEERVQY